MGNPVYYDWWHRYRCEKCGKPVKNRAGWRWCDEHRAEEYAKVQREAKRRYHEKQRGKNCQAKQA